MTGGIRTQVLVQMRRIAVGVTQHNPVATARDALNLVGGGTQVLWK